MNAREIRSLRTVVERGAKYLDERRPSWFTKINTTKLDVQDCDLCVLGQLYGNSGTDGYSRGLKLLNGAVAKNPEKFGFDEGDWFSNEQWEKVTELWKQEVALRRKARRAVAA